MKEPKKDKDMLKVQGRMAMGYGIVPKIPMQDTRLTIEAKAIYAYFCSFAGAGTTAFPSRDKILHDLKIGKDRYYKHFDLLVKYGYIEVKQNICVNGKFRNNIYMLMDTLAPCPENKDTGKEPCPCFPDTAVPDTDNPDTENKDTNNISLKNNNTNINSFSYNQQSMSEQKKTPVISSRTAAGNTLHELTSDIECKKEEINCFGDEGTPQDVAEVAQMPLPESLNFRVRNKHTLNIAYNHADYDFYKRRIHENIDYDDYLSYRKESIGLVDEIVNCMLDVIFTKSETVKIKGEFKSREMVIGTYLDIDSSDIDHILYNYGKQRHKIKQPHAYLKTMLYTVKMECEHFYENAVLSDGTVQ